MTIYLVSVGDTRYHYAPHVEVFIDFGQAQRYAIQELQSLDLDYAVSFNSSDLHWNIHKFHGIEGVEFVQFETRNLPSPIILQGA